MTENGQNSCVAIERGNKINLNVKNCIAPFFVAITPFLFHNLVGKNDLETGFSITLKMINIYVAQMVWHQQAIRIRQYSYDTEYLIVLYITKLNMNVQKHCSANGKNKIMTD